MKTPQTTNAPSSKIAKKIALGLSISSYPLLQRLKSRKHIDLVALTPKAASNLDSLPEDLLVTSAKDIIKSHWETGKTFIFVGAIGAVTRLIAPLLINKESDPAVLVVDANGLKVVPLLGGHKGGAETLALELAEDLGGDAFITGNTNSQNFLPLDSFGDAWGWKRRGDLAHWHQLMLNQASENSFTIYQDSGSKLWRTSKGAQKSLVENNKDKSHLSNILRIGAKTSNHCSWHPPTLWIGIGCEKNTSLSLLSRAIKNALREEGLAQEAVAGIGSIDIKSKEPALLKIAKQKDWPIRFFNSENLSKVSVPNPSDAVNAVVGTCSVAEASALLAAKEDSILLKEKHIYRPLEQENGAATIAIARSKQPYAPQRGEIHLVGSGPGDIAYLTNDARFALARSVVWIGYKRYLDLLEPIRRCHQVRIDSQLTYEKDRCNKAIDLAMQGVRVALISSGESGIYGMSGLTMEILLEQPQENRPELNIHPGISSMQLAAAKIGVPLMNDFCVISLSDKLTPWEVIKKRIIGAAMGDFVIAIYNPKSKDRDWQLQNAIEIVRKYRTSKTPIALARQVGRSEEKFGIFTLDNFPISKVDMLTIVLIGNSQSIEKDGYFISPRGYLNL